MHQFASMEYIWNSSDLKSNWTHLWYKKNTLCSTKYLGLVDCPVSAKPLGIVSAERCWGEVKELIGGQRVNLNADKVSALTIIQGHYRAEKSLNKRNERFSSNNYVTETSHELWDESNMSALGLSKCGLNLDKIIGKIKDKQIFRAWFED